MSSAAAGGSSSNTGEKNFAEVGNLEPGQVVEGQQQLAKEFGTTATVAAEAQQGEGPAAASASGSAFGATEPKASVVSVCVGSGCAAAGCEFAVVAVSANTAAAASQIGVVVVGPEGAAATCNAANGSNVAIKQQQPT